MKKITFIKHLIKNFIVRCIVFIYKKKLYKKMGDYNELFFRCYVKQSKFALRNLNLFIPHYRDGFIRKENIKIERDDLGLRLSYIPQDDWKIEYDGISEIVTWENSNEKYIIHPAVKNDNVLKRYHIDAECSYFILRFIGCELTDLGGISRKDRQSYYFTQDDFPRGEKNQKFRILQAPIIALYTPGLYVKGLREEGYHADQMILSESGFGWLVEEKPDFDLKVEEVSATIARARKIEFLIYALKTYDIFHLHSNWSLLGADPLWTLNCDMGYLKKMGKIIVSSAWGMCDITPLYMADHDSECDVCTQLRPVRCESEAYTEMIQVTKKYSNIRLCSGRACVVFQDIVWIDNAIDIEKYSPDIKNRIPKKFQLPKTTNLRIYHSFGNSEVRDDTKGTKYIKAAVERLQAEGYTVEFMFFNKIVHDDLRYYQAQADIVIDQLHCGWYGSTGVECLALGKAVITYVNPIVVEFLENRGREIPVINANTKNIYEVLKEVIDNRQKIFEYEQKARKYAEKYHDYRVVAKKLYKLYEEIDK